MRCRNLSWSKLLPSHPNYRAPPTALFSEPLVHAQLTNFLLAFSLESLMQILHVLLTRSTLRPMLCGFEALLPLVPRSMQPSTQHRFFDYPLTSRGSHDPLSASADELALYAKKIADLKAANIARTYLPPFTVANDSRPCTLNDVEVPLVGRIGSAAAAPAPMFVGTIIYTPASLMQSYFSTLNSADRRRLTYMQGRFQAAAGDLPMPPDMVSLGLTQDALDPPAKQVWDAYARFAYTSCILEDAISGRQPNLDYACQEATAELDIAILWTTSIQRGNGASDITSTPRGRSTFNRHRRSARAAFYNYLDRKSVV